MKPLVGSALGIATNRRSICICICIYIHKETHQLTDLDGGDGEVGVAFDKADDGDTSNDDGIDNDGGNYDNVMNI